MKLQGYHRLHDTIPFRQVEEGSAGERSATIVADEWSASGGGSSCDVGCGSGPGGMAGAGTCQISGSTGGIGAAAYKIAPPDVVFGGATSSVGGYPHITSGEAVNGTSRGRTWSSISTAVREENFYSSTPFNSIAGGSGR